MFALVVPNYPPWWLHSDLWHNDDECDYLKFLCHFTQLIWYITCWTIILECKVSEKLIQHGNWWGSPCCLLLNRNPSITDGCVTIGLCKYYDCLDHSRYVWVVFLVDTIWLKIEWMTALSVRNMGNTVVKYNFESSQQSDHFAKVPYRWWILMKLCRCILQTYNCMLHALEWWKLIFYVVYRRLQNLVLKSLPTLKWSVGLFYQSQFWTYLDAVSRTVEYISDVVHAVDSSQHFQSIYRGLQVGYYDRVIQLYRGVFLYLLSSYAFYGAVAMLDDVRGSVLSVTRVIVKDLCNFIVIAVIVVSFFVSCDMYTVIVFIDVCCTL